MTALARAFVAIVPPPDVLDSMERAVAPVRMMDALRWTPSAQWHLTLQFLGRVPDRDAAARELASAFAGCVGAPVELGALGAFPSPRRATVLWVGVRRGSERLAEMAARVASAVGAIGLAVEERAYRPHVTVARAPAPVDLRAVVDAAPTVVGPPWVANEAVLFESVLERGGARHIPCARFALASRSSDR